jgi:hypothetical protein
MVVVVWNGKNGVVFGVLVASAKEEPPDPDE